MNAQEKEDFIVMKQDVKEIKNQIVGLKCDFKEFISAVDKKYATKVETGFLDERLKVLNTTVTNSQKVTRGWVQQVVPWILTAAALVVAIIAMGGQ